MSKVRERLKKGRERLCKREKLRKKYIVKLESFN